jgi:hypothetical protein
MASTRKKGGQGWWCSVVVTHLDVDLTYGEAELPQLRDARPHKSSQVESSQVNSCVTRGHTTERPSERAHCDVVTDVGDGRTLMLAMATRSRVRVARPCLLRRVARRGEHVSVQAGLAQLLDAPAAIDDRFERHACQSTIADQGRSRTRDDRGRRTIADEGRSRIRDDRGRGTIADQGRSRTRARSRTRDGVVRKRRDDGRRAADARTMDDARDGARQTQGRWTVRGRRRDDGRCAAGAGTTMDGARQAQGPGMVWQTQGRWTVRFDGWLVPAAIAWPIDNPAPWRARAEKPDAKSSAASTPALTRSSMVTPPIRSSFALKPAAQSSATLT